MQPESFTTVRTFSPRLVQPRWRDQAVRRAPVLSVQLRFDIATFFFACLRGLQSGQCNFALNSQVTPFNHALLSVDNYGVRARSFVHARRFISRYRSDSGATPRARERRARFDPWQKNQHAFGVGCCTHSASARGFDSSGCRWNVNIWHWCTLRRGEGRACCRVLDGGAWRWPTPA